MSPHPISSLHSHKTRPSAPLGPTVETDLGLLGNYRVGSRVCQDNTREKAGYHHDKDRVGSSMPQVGVISSIALGSGARTMLEPALV
eukprot:751917-Hanusia_phi.AAC.2